MVATAVPTAAGLPAATRVQADSPSLEPTAAPTPTTTPRATPAPNAIATPEPTPALTRTASSTLSPTPTPAVHSLVPGYSQLLVKAASMLPGKYGFFSGGLRV